MKKAILVLAVFAAVGFSSCKKCDTCEGGSLDGEEYCESNDAARDAFKTTCEFAGGSIK